MIGRVITLVLARAGSQLAAGESVVRRAPYDAYDAEFEPAEAPKHKRSKHFLSGDETSDVSQEDHASGMHCVVWGDWNFASKKFPTQDEADEFFKQKKHTELAAAQYHGSRQVHRYMSKRMVKVDWAKMKGSCNEDHPEAALAEDAPPQYEKAEVRVNKNGAIIRNWDDASERESSLFESSSMERHRHKYNPVISSLATSSTGVAATLDTKASTLSGKVSLLENELNSLATMASGLLKSIGVEDTTSKGAAMLQSGHHHHGESHGKLKSRLGDLEEFTASVQEKTNLLETEFFGTTTAEKSMSTRGEAGHSFKMKIEALAAQVDELKSRLSALESTPLLGEVAKLEEKSAHLGSEAARLFTSIGVEGVTASAIPNGLHQPVKARLSSLEGYAEHMQRGAATLEYEILGNSWNLPASGDSQKAGSIKDHAASLGDKLHDLESRVSSLASAPIVGDVGKMEDAVTSLSSRAAALSKNVGLTGKTAQDGLVLAGQGSALKPRIAALEGYITKMQSTTAALEEELAGNVGTMPAQSQKDTLKSKAKFMELQVENVNARISALEQQV